MPDARQIAFDILMRVQEGERTLDYVLEQDSDRIERLNRPDRALIHALVFGVLRFRAHLDWIIDHMAARRSGIDPSVRMILRMGLFQLRFLTRIPASAAVNTAVGMTRSKGRPWASGFVNGLLRRAASSASDPPWPDRGSRPAAHLASRHSFPEWMIARWIARWGIDQTEELCRTINTIPQTTLRVNALRVARESYIRGAGDGFQAVATAISPEGVRVISSGNPVTQWPGYDEGWFQVQDEAAQLIAHMVAPLPGQPVWDACAGLGTKTAHLAQLMENRGTLLASDSRPDKLSRLQPEMQRLGVTIVRTQVLDLGLPLNPSGIPRFARILLDAPCSGAGVMQRNPDTKWRLQPADLIRNQSRQLLFLETAASRLDAGGLLVYSVCSFEPEETSDVILAFLQKHTEFVIEPPEMHTAPQARSLITPEGWLSTMPHRHAMDGFFAAALRRKR